MAFDSATWCVTKNKHFKNDIISQLSPMSNVLSSSQFVGQFIDFEN